MLIHPSLKSSTGTLFLVLFTAMSFAYEPAESRGYLGVSLGPAIPVGVFAQKDINSEASGFARNGATFDAHFTYQLSDMFGFCAILRSESHAMDTEPYLKHFRANEPDINWSGGATLWSTGGFMCGGFYSLPLSSIPGSFLEIRAQVGIFNTSSPQVSFVAIKGNMGGYITQESKSANATAFSAGSILRYTLGERFSLLLNIDYFATNPEFLNVTQNYTGDLKRVHFSQRYTTVNAGLGLAYHLQ